MVKKNQLAIIFLFALNVSFVVGAVETPSSNHAWSQKMQELRSVLSELLPDLFSDEQYNSPENFKRIETNVKKLVDLAHAMPDGASTKAKTVTIPDEDPSIVLISGLFKDQVLRASQDLRSGRRPYARKVLKTVTNFCIVCHTRSSSPVDFSSLQEEVPKSLTSPLERAEFFDATRQFDRALVEFDKILEDPLAAKDRQLEWERALRYGIATAVRVKRDSNRALALVNRVISSPASPVFLKEEALRWQASLEEWKEEESQKPMTADGLFAEAKDLIARARKLQEYPADRGADILYLRASAALHDFLSQYSGNSNSGEALLLLGDCYETLRDMELWSLHDLYFEACVRQFPHTPIALACYRRYEQSTFLGYTGSAGTSLPTDVRRHMNELRILADVIGRIP